MLHQVIETLNARVALRPRYDNFIGGEWVAPVEGQYFDNLTPDHRQADLRGCPLAGRRTSSWRSTPRTRPRTPGATPRRPSAPRS